MRGLAGITDESIELDARMRRKNGIDSRYGNGHICSVPTLRSLLSTVLPTLAFLTQLSAETNVLFTRLPDGYSISTDLYTAQVENSGSLSSLKIGGREFLAPPVETNQKLRITGVHASPFIQGQLPYKLPPLQTQRDQTIHCEGNGWILDYSFFPDAIEFAFSGTPQGELPTEHTGKPFKAGPGVYPAELVLSLAYDLQRAADPDTQGELGWPVNRKHEPGNFVVLDSNGAGFVAEKAGGFKAIQDSGIVPSPPHRLDLLEFYSRDDKSPGPVVRRIRIFRKPELSHAVTLQIVSPNRQHIFSRVDEVVFPVKVSALYGETLKGTVTFRGSPFVWQKPELTAEIPVELTSRDSSRVVELKLRPPTPGHYTGVVSITQAGRPIYNQRVGFLYRPEEIPPAQPPADFDAFWDTTLAQLEQIPLDMTLEEQPDKETPLGKVFKVRYRSWESRWAWAWLNVPKGEGRYPAKIVLPPVSAYQPGLAGPATDELSIRVAVHGGDIKDRPAKSDFDYMNTGITSRETYMLRYSYCCLVRCFDIIRSHDKCNGAINVEGSSQGAGLTLVLTGLRNAKQGRGIAVALCRIDWTILGYTRWGPQNPPGADAQQIAEVVRYYDPGSFAHRVHTPLKLAFGLFDWCAPAEAIFTALNALPKETPCELLVDPYGDHFTIDSAGFLKDEGMLEVPRWEGSAAENKMRQ